MVSLRYLMQLHTITSAQVAHISKGTQGMTTLEINMSLCKNDQPRQLYITDCQISFQYYHVPRGMNFNLNYLCMLLRMHFSAEFMS